MNFNLRMLSRGFVLGGDNVEGRDVISEGERRELTTQMEMFEMMELLWSLCEIIFINVIPGTIFRICIFKLRYCFANWWAQANSYSPLHVLFFGVFNKFYWQLFDLHGSAIFAEQYILWTVII